MRHGSRSDIKPHLTEIHDLKVKELKQYIKLLCTRQNTLLQRLHQNDLNQDETYHIFDNDDSIYFPSVNKFNIEMKSPRQNRYDERECDGQDDDYAFEEDQPYIEEIQLNDEHNNEYVSVTKNEQMSITSNRLHQKEPLKVKPSMASKPEKYKELQQYTLSFVLNNEMNSAIHDYSSNRLADARESLKELKHLALAQYNDNQQLAESTASIIHKSLKHHHRKSSLKHRKAMLEKEIRELKATQPHAHEPAEHTPYLHRTPRRLSKFIETEFDSPILENTLLSPTFRFNKK
mmetsp:Transcript_10175/g.14907  ORF Transcript_10175/g.14907 Transcript_10175/m.14907 type:complete len:290 (+) Transcript_10175:489-1358(+)